MMLEVFQILFLIQMIAFALTNVSKSSFVNFPRLLKLLDCVLGCSTSQMDLPRKGPGMPNQLNAPRRFHLVNGSTISVDLMFNMTGRLCNIPIRCACT